MIALIMAAALAGQVNSYGAPISLKDAKQVMAAAQAEAAKRKIPATIAIVDPYGELVLAEAGVDADGGALDVAMLQARASVDYRGKLVLSQQSTRGVSYTSAPPVTAAMGASGMGAGALLISNGKIIGAIGDTSINADKVAQAGAAAATTLPPAPPPAAAAPRAPGAAMAPAAMPAVGMPAGGMPAAGMPVPAGGMTPGAAAPAGFPDANYGPPIAPDDARTVGVKAETEKARIGTDQAAIAVVDPAGRLVYFARQDNSTFGNLEMAVLKARAAARLRRPTSGDATRLKTGDQILLLVPGAFPADGGQPIIKNGLLIGAVGLAGGGADGPIGVTAAKALN